MSVNAPELVGVPIHHDRGMVTISGAEEAHWGKGSVEQNSVAAALEAFSKLFHFPGVDYSILMGVSAHAFRIQVSVEGLCPNSPNPTCGRQTAARAFSAVPIEWGTIQAGLAGTAQAEDAVSQVRVAIDKGYPVLAMGEETDLVLGHFHDHLVGQTHDSTDEGYTALNVWPWTFMIPERRSAVHHPVEQIRDGVVAAVEDWDATEPVDGYWTGAVAYANWRAKLQETSVAALDLDACWRFQHGNATIMDCLVDARRSGYAFLMRVQNMLGAEARSHLTAAAEIYRNMAEHTLKGHEGRIVAPYPWQCDHDHPWDAEYRQAQVDVLIAAEHEDQKAIDHLRHALQASH